MLTYPKPAPNAPDPAYDALLAAVRDSARLAHGSRRHAKALRAIEAVCLRALGFSDFAAFASATAYGATDGEVTR